MSGTIGSNTGTSTVNYNQLNKTGEVNIKELGVGGGMLNQTGSLPPAPQGDPSKITASLTAFMSNGANGVDTEVLLVTIAVEMRDVESKTQKEKITSDQEKQRAAAQDKREKLEEAQKKLEEAKEKEKSASLLDKIKLAFEWIGAAIAVIAAVALIATGAGAVAGAFLLAAAVTAVVMAIDSTVQVATGMGIAGNIQYAIDKNINGLSDEDAKANAQKADMGFKIALAVIGVVASIGGGFASAGTAAYNAGNAAYKAGETVGKIVSAAKDAFLAAMKSSASLMTKTIEYTQAGITAANETGKGITMASKAKLSYDATELKADAQKLQGQSKEDEAMLKMLEDMIDQALTRLMASGNRFAAMLEDIMSGLHDRGNALASARFSG